MFLFVFFIFCQCILPLTGQSNKPIIIIYHDRESSPTVLYLLCSWNSRQFIIFNIKKKITKTKTYIKYYSCIFAELRAYIITKSCQSVTDGLPLLRETRSSQKNFYSKTIFKKKIAPTTTAAAAAIAAAANNSVEIYKRAKPRYGRICYCIHLNKSFRTSDWYLLVPEHWIGLITTKYV